MKKKIVKLILCVIMLLTVHIVSAQTIGATYPIKFENIYHLSISAGRTTSLIFPYSIVGIDRGNKDVLVQKAKGVENILQVKAAHDSLKETNLTVITADGTLYSFLLDYKERPSLLTMSFKASEGTSASRGILDANINDEAMIHRTAQLVAVRQPSIRGLKAKNTDVTLRVDGIYINEGFLYFQLTLDNRSNVGYDISQLRFFIRDEQRTKRTAWQEVEQRPVYIEGDAKAIEPQSRHTVVVVLPKFTLTDKKLLVAQLMELNGGRNMEVTLKNRILVQAPAINN